MTNQTPLKRYLTENKIKIVWLAKEIGLTTENLSKIINGWATESTERRWAPVIAEKLGVPVSYLFPELEAVVA